MKRRMVVSLLLSSLLVVIHSSAWAQWVQTNGPASGDVNAMAVIGTELFAGSTQNGVFRSTDQGANWSPANAGLLNTSVYAFAVASAGLFAGTDRGVVLSADHGATWLSRWDGLPALSVKALAVDGTLLVAGTEGGGVFISADDGAHWTPAAAGLSSMNVRALVTAGTDLFAGTDAGIFRSSDHGASWVLVASGLTTLAVNTLFADGSALYAGTDAGGVFVSVDRGANWMKMSNGIAPHTKVRAIQTLDGFLFAGTIGAGVYVSSDYGANWTLAQNGLPKINTLCFASIGSTLFAGILGGGVFRSTDHAGTWTAVNHGMTTSIVLALASNGGRLYSGMFRNHCYISQDDGANWAYMNTGLTAVSVMSFVVSGATVYAGSDDGVFSTTDNGATWTALNNGLTPKYASALAINGSTLIAGTSAGIYVSPDQGAHWVLSSAGLPPDTYIHSLLAAGDRIYAGTAGYGLYASSDNGASWSPATTGLPSSSYILALASAGTTLYAGSAGSGFFVSTDNGAHWNEANTGLGDLTVNAIIVNGGTLYAGTNGGVFQSDNSGASWTPLNSGLTNLTVKTLLASGMALYAGTEGSGVLRFALNDPTPVVISGSAGVEGATITWVDGTEKTATSDAAGNYSIEVSSHWSGTVTPSKPNYLFRPASRTYVNVQGSLAGENYTALMTYTISGNTGGGSETLTWFDDTVRTVKASPSGNYTITVPAHWSGTITPSKLGYLFYPEARSYTDVTSNLTTPTYSTWRGIIISGNAGAPGVTLTWVDGKQKSVVSDSAGMYSITVSYSYNGTVTPVLPGCSFSPPRITYVSQRTDALNNNYQVSGSVSVNVKALLAGAWSGGAMSTALNAQGLLPLNSNEAYNAAVYNYAPKSVSSIPSSSIVDWVLIELRTGTAASTRVAVQAGFIRNDGMIVDVDGSSQLPFPGIVPGSYYIAICHRNHLMVMTSQAVPLSLSSLLYDFTTGMEKAYGTYPMTPLSGSLLYGMHGGDANRDGQVTGSDYNLFSPRFSSISSGYDDADLNMDGRVTGTDYNIFSPAYAAIRASGVPQ